MVNLWVDNKTLYNDWGIPNKKILDIRDIDLKLSGDSKIKYNLIRDLPNNGTDHKYPLYYRIDFIKNVIAYHELQNVTYAVVLDLDINNLPDDDISTRLQCWNDKTKILKKIYIERKSKLYTKEFLFDETTLATLNTFGFIMACSHEDLSGEIYENSFMIFKNTENIKELVKLWLIEFSLSLQEIGRDKEIQQYIYKEIQQYIYGMYKQFITFVICLAEEYCGISKYQSRGNRTTLCISTIDDIKEIIGLIKIKLHTPPTMSMHIYRKLVQDVKIPTKSLIMPMSRFGF
jgi:hypothetical protein